MKIAHCLYTAFLIAALSSTAFGSSNLNISPWTVGGSMSSNCATGNPICLSTVGGGNSGSAEAALTATGSTYGVKTGFCVRGTGTATVLATANGITVVHNTYQLDAVNYPEFGQCADIYFIVPAGTSTVCRIEVTFNATDVSTFRGGNFPPYGPVFGPQLVGPSTLIRTDSGTFTIYNAAKGAKVSGWKFTDGTNTLDIIGNSRNAPVSA